MLPSMPVTGDFTARPVDFTSQRSVLVDETRIVAISQPALAGLIGGPHVLSSATFLLDFDVEHYGLNGAVLVVKPPGSGGTPCYFLPYKPNCATSLVLGHAADYFFTSSMSGCSVQVLGSRATPTVTHANGRTAYEGAAAGGEDAASGAAQAAIEAMFHSVADADRVGYVRKSDYLGKLTHHNVKEARKRFHLQEGQKLGTLRPATTNGKPEIGAFVFGVRTGSGWTFYFQSTVGVTGTRRTGLFGLTPKRLGTDEVVLGMPVQFFP